MDSCMMDTWTTFALGAWFGACGVLFVMTAWYAARGGAR